MQGKISCIKYRSPQELYDLLWNGTIVKDALVVTATGSMANILRQRAAKKENLQFKDTPRPWNFVEVSMLLRKWLRGWHSSKTILKQSLKLGDILECRELLVTDEDRRVLRKNRTDILNASRLLVEMGIAPKEIPVTNRSEKLFQQVYAEYDVFLRKYIWKDASRLNKICTVAKPREKLSKEDKEHILGKCKTIYMQGFYYILPLQAELIEALRSLGKDICFLNHYDERIPEVFDVYKENRHFQSLEEVVLPASPQPRLIPYYVDVFSGVRRKQAVGRPVQRCNKINIHKYADVFSFAEDISSAVKGDEVSIYSPNGNDLTDFFETFFPEQEKADKNGEARKEHLLSYPIGQYIFTLYNMWDEDAQALRYSVEDIRTCLATGWAGCHSTDGSRILRLFDKVSVFFRDCCTLSEWQNQLGQLEMVHEKIAPLFDHAIDVSAYPRWHKLMGNPLIHVAVYTISKEDFLLLRETIGDIFTDAQLLYQKGGRVDLIEHFKRLRKLLNEKAAAYMMEQEEREATDRVLKRLYIDPENMPIKSCSADNLSEAMSFFLGGELDKAAGAEAEGQELSTGARSGLSDIEAEFLKETVHPIHVCFCDDKHVPGGSRPYPWPMSRSFFDEMAARLKQGKPDKAGLCEDYIYYMESSRLSGRYLFFLALQFPEVTISWVEEYGSEKLNGSAYLKLIGKAEEDKVQTEDLPQVEADKILSRQEAMEYIPLDIPTDRQPEEIKFNKLFCPYRNFYDYGLQEYPGIENEFQMQFYISMLLRFVNSSMYEVDLDETEERVHKLFPMGNSVERALRKTYGQSTRNLSSFPHDYSELEGCSYKMSRLYLKYLNKNLIENLIGGRSCKAGENCIYCPHKNVCYWQFEEEGADDDK